MQANMLVHAQRKHKQTRSFMLYYTVTIKPTYLYTHSAFIYAEHAYTRYNSYNGIKLTLSDSFDNNFKLNVM